MFLGYQNEKIVLVANTKEELENTPCMVFDKIEESPVDYELYNGEYIPSAEAQAKREKAEKEELKKKYYAEMDKLDLKVIRPLRAKAAGTATEEDEQKIIEYEEQMQELRRKVKELNEPDL